MKIVIEREGYPDPIGEKSGRIRTASDLQSVSVELTELLFDIQDLASNHLKVKEKLTVKLKMTLSLSSKIEACNRSTYF